MQPILCSPSLERMVGVAHPTAMFSLFMSTYLIQIQI
jgi:hypothetical protein